MTVTALEDRVFHALADPSRRAIFESLCEGEAPVKALTGRFELSQPAISQHLSTLLKAGLVDRRKEGRQVFYRVEPEGLSPLVDWVARYRSFWNQRLGQLETLLEEMDG